MLIANDKENNRLYANSGVRYKECYCPVCGEALTHRIGQFKAPHFAHKKDSNCAYGKDKDSKSPWHIHMQELFPPETLEVRFSDPATGELKHIADVFLKESNTVIEFQKSPISAQDFVSRTLFHIQAGRRIVWVFDESKEGEEFGRLRRCEDAYLATHYRYPNNLDFDWPRSPRKVLNCFQGEILDAANKYSVCLYYGEEDTVHRIVAQALGYKEILFSLHPIILKGDMNTDEFFYSERHWQQQYQYCPSVPSKPSVPQPIINSGNPKTFKRPGRRTFRF